MQFRRRNIFLSAAREFVRFRRSQRGTAAIEFVAIAPIYIAVLLAGLQIAVIFIAQAYLETVAEEGARLVLTNQANSYTQAQFQTAICGKVSALFNCSNIIVALQAAPSTASAIPAAMPKFDTTGNLIGTTNYAVSAAPSKMMLVVLYQWPVIGAPLGFSIGNLGNGSYLMVSTQVFQIELPTS